MFIITHIALVLNVDTQLNIALDTVMLLFNLGKAVEITTNLYYCTNDWSLKSNGFQTSLIT